MGSVTELRPVEGICLDPGRLAVLYVEFGPVEAESLLNRAVGEMALVMSMLVEQFEGGALEEFGRNLRSLRRVAEHVGLAGLARGADAVTRCLASRDMTALAATWARLLRLGERSLSTGFDLRGMSR